MPSRRRQLSLASMLATCVTTSTAMAQDVSQSAEAQAAEESFRQGQQAVERGEYLAAARAFARADQLAPNPLALQAGLDVSLMADDAALGMELVERAEKLRSTPSWNEGIADGAGKARAQFAPRVGKLRIDCSACTGVVDGLPYPAREARWVGIGKHRVELAESGRSVQREIEVVAGQETVTSMPAAPSPPETPLAPPPAVGGGISPAFFFVGLGLTLGSGGGLIASALDTRSKHADFETDTSNVTLKEEGESAQLRTNILIGVTGALGATTVILAIVTDWASLSPEQQPVAVTAGPGEGGMAVEARF